MKRNLVKSLGHVALLRLMRDRLEGHAPVLPDPSEVPVSEYTLADRFDRERRAIFMRLPSLVAFQQELSEPGACLGVEVAGTPLLLVKGQDGTTRAFRNACRHRSTELVAERGFCHKKAFVCPYHGWTYDLEGRLIHVPRAEAFRGADQARAALVPAHAAVRHGLVWAGLQPFDVARHLGPLDGDLGALGASEWTVYRRSTRTVRGNWKLVFDAFHESYHLQRLHRRTLARFFIDSLSEAERAGLHFRTVAARQALSDFPAGVLDAKRLRELATPGYTLFPNALFILHPDYTSVLMVDPIDMAQTRIVHVMAIPHAIRDGAEEAHWAKSFHLIDECVLQREDLAMVEAMQRGLSARADESLLFGDVEYPARWFHDTVNRTLRRDARSTLGA